MAYIDDHCKDVSHYTDAKDGCKEIHMFLDQYAAVFPVAYFYDYHRTFLHNTYGVRICAARWGEIGKIAAIIHLTRDYCGMHMQNWSLEKILKEFPKYLMWYNLLQTEFKPDSRVVRHWDNRGIVSIAYPEGR